MPNNTKLMFDTFLQKDTPHTISLNPNGNGEIIFTSTEPHTVKVPDLDDKGLEQVDPTTGLLLERDEQVFHFVKFPKDTTPAVIDKYLADYKVGNQGQVSAAKYKEAETRLIEMFADGATPSAPLQ